jgi:hypothetical protein
MDDTNMYSDNTNALSLSLVVALNVFNNFTTTVEHPSTETAAERLQVT